MIDLNDISFTLPVQVDPVFVPERCASAFPSVVAAPPVRRIQTPAAEISPQCLHESLDALEEELTVDNNNRIDIIGHSLGAIADEINRMPLLLSVRELSALLKKIELISLTIQRKEIESPPHAKTVRKILTPSLEAKCSRTKTPLCPPSLQYQESEETRRYLFP